MQLRKCTAILLTSFILFSNLGLALNIHYCHDRISNISINIDEKDSCVEEVKICCSTNDSHASCCSNKELKTDKKTDNLFTKSFQLELYKCYLEQVNEKLNTIAVFNGISNRLLPYYCFSNAPPIYKLNCQLVFYA